MMAIPSEDETLSQQLIARLFDEERSFAAAEALQLDLALHDSAPKGQRRAGRHSEAPPEDQDFHMAVSMTADLARAAADSSIAQHLHSRDGAQTSGDRQYAMKLAASERRFQLDIEFAKALQRLDDEDGIDLADGSIQDVEAVLGSDMVQKIMVSDSSMLYSEYYYTETD